MNGYLKKLSERALSSEFTVSQSYWAARYCIDHEIPGDFVECGVFAGTQCAAMAKAIIDTGATGRRVHMFDSFAGIPKAGEFDNDIRPLVGTGPITESSGVSICTVDQVRQHMAEWKIPEDLLVYHRGLFQDQIPGYAATRQHRGIDGIALLRLDGDLYESTKVCMEHLYPLLSHGGVCIIDDYSLDGCRRAVDNYMRPRGGIPGPVYWLKA